MTTLELSDETKQLLENSDTRPLVISFLTKLPQKMDKIRADSHSPSLHQLKMDAHELKGVALSFGFEDIGAAASQLEQDVITNNTEMLENDLHKLEIATSIAYERMKGL